MQNGLVFFILFSLCSLNKNSLTLREAPGGFFSICETFWKSAKKCDEVLKRFCPLVVALLFFFDSTCCFARFYTCSIGLGGPNGLLPLAHQNRAVTESFGKSEIPGPKHFCDLSRKLSRHRNSDHLMAFKVRVFHFPFL